jgi:hypothetical protein
LQKTPAKGAGILVPGMTGMGGLVRLEVVCGALLLLKEGGVLLLMLGPWAKRCW